MYQKRLLRSPNKILGGVCAGIAEYYGWDPTMVRIGVVLISLITAIVPTFLVYVVMWFVIPEAPYNNY